MFINNSLQILLRLVKIFFLALLTLFVLQTSLIANSTLDPLVPPDTSSPQGTMKSFVENVNRSYQTLMPAYRQYQKEPGLFPSASVREGVREAKILLERAEGCLNLSEIPSRLKQDKALESTLMLKAIFDRVEIPTYDRIPDLKVVTTDKKFSKWTVPNTEINIIKIEKGDNAGEFLFSPETVARLPEFYEKVKDLPYKSGVNGGFYKFYLATPGILFPSKWMQIFPGWLKVIYFDHTLWQWIGLLISVSIGFWVSYKMLQLSLQRMSTLAARRQIWKLMVPPLIAIGTFEALNYFLNHVIYISGELLVVALTILDVIFWMMVALAIFVFGNGIAETIIFSAQIDSKSLNARVIRAICRLLSLTTATTIFIVGIKSVGIYLAPILAGLGIGGMAIALGAQSTLENLIAGLILAIDKPVQVGDLCSFADGEGFVMSIGWRSTQIRSLEGDTILIPNSQFSKLALTNETRRNSFRLNQTIRLSYDTTPEQMNLVLKNLREMILTYPKVVKDKVAVRFVKYGDRSLDVQILTYIHTTQKDEFQQIQEDVLLQAKTIVHAAGVSFAIGYVMLEE